MTNPIKIADVVTLNPHHRHAKFSADEANALLERAARGVGCSPREVMVAIGYSGWSPGQWEQGGGAPVRTKYALLGFIADMGLRVTPESPDLVLNKDQALDLWLLLHGRGDRVPAEARSELLKVIGEFATR